MSDELVLQLDPPYAGSAVSPTVDITETTTDVTVTITDFRGEHSYSVEKTDQAIADAEQATSNANTAAANATSTANTAAQNADAKAALADSKAALANQAATTANNAAQAAEAAKTAANTAAGQATTAAGNATTAAGTANAAAGNANAKAQLADTAAANADTATANANTATTNATNAAQAANNAADVAIEAAEDMPKLVNMASGTTPQTVNDAWPTTPESAVLYGKSVQDGTPTPDNPVPVQVVEGRNLLNVAQAVPSAQCTIEATETGYDITVTTPANYTNVALYVDGIEDGQYHFSSDYEHELYRITAGQTDVLGTLDEFTKFKNSYSVLPNFNFTISDKTKRYLVFVLYPGASIEAGTVIHLAKVQLEAGTQVTPYVPYGSIGLQIGETVTPIDLQGHTLASLPDGTRDVLRVDSTGRVWIDRGADILTFDGSNMAGWTQQVLSGVNYMRYQPGGTTPYIALNANNSMCNRLPFIQNVSTGIGYSNTNVSMRVRYTEDTGATLAQFTEWLQSNPLTIIVPRNERQTIELGTITPPNIAPGDTLAIYASLDPEWSIEYEQDPNAVITSLQSSIAPAEGGTASTNYAVNSYLIHGNQLYRVTSAIATGEAITPGSNCTACTVMGEIIRLTA